MKPERLNIGYLLKRRARGKEAKIENQRKRESDLNTSYKIIQANMGLKDDCVTVSIG